jgi:hypothetical protein
MKRILIFFLLFGFIPTYMFADHMMGGEITWQCQPNGNFVFTLKLYRDCNGIPGIFGSITMQTTVPESTPSI